MNNPWTAITKVSRVLTIDSEMVQMHNQLFRNKQERCLSTLDYPEPFLGTPHASIYLLLANPGRDLEKEHDAIQFVENKNLEGTIIGNLRHNSVTRFPFYYLNPKFEGHPGYDWWTRALGGLLKVAKSRQVLSREIFSAELYGYHSVNCEKRLLNKKHSLQSSEYSYYLVRKAIEQEKLILLPRAVAEWFEKVPELKKYDNCFIVASNRGISLSENTISPLAFKKVRKILSL